MQLLEMDARKVLTDSYAGVQRQDLVARQLSRLGADRQKAD